jgi:hypothetical protein
MPARLFALLAVSLALAAAPKPPAKVATATGENKDVALTVTLYLDPADVERLVGDDLGKHFIIADVKFAPRNGKELLVDRDDFTLRTDSNGAHTTPFAPSQIAGSGALIIREVSGEGEAKTSSSIGPFGFPGRKRTESKKNADSKKDKSAQNKEPETPAKPATEGDKPLEQTLKEKELPQKKTSQPVSGLLYFEMEKQKMKDLSVTYGPKDDSITLRFK